MIFKKFDNGQDQSVGAELELRLLCKNDLSLQNEFSYIYENIPAQYKNNLASEFLASMVEINSPVYQTPQEIAHYFKSCVNAIQQCATKKGIIAATSGAYSLKSNDIIISNNERYKKLFDEHKILLDDFHICGLHVHIGFENFDEALQAFNFSLKFLPFLVALSASSAFFNGKLTGIHSYRTKIFDRLPKASIPEYFDTYEQMKALLDILYENEVIKSEKDIWWDIRIQPNLKTIEFRVCDGVADFERLEAIIALVKGICSYSKIAPIQKLPMQILKQNMWSATRYSMDAEFISGKSKTSIKDAMRQLVKELIEHNMLDSKELVLNYIEKPSVAQEMIQKYKQSNDLIEVEKIGLFKGYTK